MTETPEDRPEEHIQEQIPSLDVEPVPDTAQAAKSYPGLIKHLLIQQRTNPLKPESKSVERDRAVMKFSGWIPESEKEKNFYTDGAAERMRRAHHTRNGDPAKAVRSTYETLVDFRRQAFGKLQILDKAVTNSSGEKPEPDPELIRILLVSDSRFRGVFVDYFLSREIFNAQENPNKKSRLTRREDIEKIVMADVHMAFGGSLKEMQTAITEQLVKRANAWARQLAAVREFDYVQTALADPEYTPPSLQLPVLKNTPASFELLDMANEDPSEEAPEQIGHLVIENTFEEALPLAVKEQKAESISPRLQSRIDTLEQQQGSMYASEKRVLGASAPKTAEEIEREEIAKNANAGAIKRLKNPRKPKSAYKPGWPESGPSAKRVETDHN
jgi:hypothetical protein